MSMYPYYPDNNSDIGRYDNLSPKQFREKLRNCLKTFIKYKYKLQITDYYCNSLGMETIDAYTGILESFKLKRENPEDNFWTLNVKFTNGEEIKLEFSNDIVYIQDIRKKRKSFDIRYTTSGPYCMIKFTHI